MNARDGNDFKELSFVSRGLPSIMEEFKKYLIEHDRKVSTVKRHLWNIKLIQTHCPQFSKEEIESFYQELKEKGCKNTYLNSLTSTVRQWGHLTKNEELENFRFRKKEIFSKATMSDEEIEAFLNIPPIQVTRRHRSGIIYTSTIDPKIHQIWTVFFSIMAFTGMRPGEVAHLKVGDVDFGRQVFVITDSKTNMPGVAPIAPNIIQLVKNYINALTGEYLFASARGGSSHSGVAVFSNSDWHYNFHKRIARLGIKRPNLTPYSLRHSYATRLLESDVSLFHVKKLMRHNDLKSTLVYEHLTTQDLIKAQQKLPLIRRGTDPKTILQAISEVIKSFHIENDSRFKYRLIEDGESVKFECNIAD